MLLAGHLRRLFAFIRTVQNFTGPLFRNFVIQFIIKPFPRQLFQTVIQDTVASLITDNQEVSQTVVQDTVSSLVTSRTLSLDTSAYSSHEEFSVHMVALHLRVFLITEDYGYPYLPSLLFPGGGLILVLIMTILSLIISSLAGQLAMITNNSVSQSVNYAIILAPPTFPVI